MKSWSIPKITNLQSRVLRNNLENDFRWSGRFYQSQLLWGSTRPDHARLVHVLQVQFQIQCSVSDREEPVIRICKTSLLWAEFCFSDGTYELLKMQQWMWKTLLRMAMLVTFSMLNRISPWLGEILWSWLVWRRPRSPMLVRQTMSSFPIKVKKKLNATTYLNIY